MARTKPRLKTPPGACPNLILQSFQETQTNTVATDYFVGETSRSSRSWFQNVPQKFPLAMKLTLSARRT